MARAQERRATMRTKASRARTGVMVGFITVREGPRPLAVGPCLVAWRLLVLCRETASALGAGTTAGAARAA